VAVFRAQFQVFPFRFCTQFSLFYNVFFVLYILLCTITITDNSSCIFKSLDHPKIPVIPAKISREGDQEKQPAELGPFMTGNGRHTTGIFSRFTPRHSRCIPRYENSRSDQKNLGKLYIIPGQTRKTYAPAQLFDQEYFPVVSLIVSTRILCAAGEAPHDGCKLNIELTNQSVHTEPRQVKRNQSPWV